jgi:hypothetical protein
MESFSFECWECGGSVNSNRKIGGEEDTEPFPQGEYRFVYCNVYEGLYSAMRMQHGIVFRREIDMNKQDNLLYYSPKERKVYSQSARFWTRDPSYRGHFYANTEVQEFGITPDPGMIKLWLRMLGN